MIRSRRTLQPLGDCLRALGEGQTLGDFSLTVVTRQDFARDRPRVHQRRWESLRRELQPAQCVFRHDPKQLQAQAAQAISAQLKLCRSLVPVHDSPWRDQERTPKRRMSYSVVDLLFAH